MIENLLLDSLAIAEVATAHMSDAVDPAVVEAALFEQAQEERHDEIALRVTRELGATTIRPKGTTVEEVTNSLSTAIQNLQVAESRIEEAIANAETEVDTALADGTYVETFRGKALLRGIYRRLGVASHGLSFEQFAYAVAQRLAEAGSLAETIDTVFRSIEDHQAEELCE